MITSILDNQETIENFNNFVEEQRSFLTPDKVKKRSKKGERKTGEHKWQVTEIQEKHHQIKNLLFLGHTNEEICKILNCSTQLVSTVKNSPIIKDQLALMHTEAEAEAINVSKEIEKLIPKVMSCLGEVINKGTIDGEPISQNLRVREFNNLLDRYIGKPTQNIKTQNYNVHFTKDELEEMKMRAVEVINK